MTAKIPMDPIEFCEHFWPHVYLYDKQREIMRSVRDNDETFVPAGNMLGKDFVSGLIVLWFFMTRLPCRIVTTSAKDDHLRVLWGEIGNFIQTSKYPLDIVQGGSLVVNQREITRHANGDPDKISYIRGMVAAKDKMAAMQGHHATPTAEKEAEEEYAEVEEEYAKFSTVMMPSYNDNIPRTLFVGDEASSLPDEYFTMARTWARRMLIIGNTWPCENSFKHAVKGKPGTDDKGGDIPAPNNGHYYRKVIHIRAEDSPNVKLGLQQEARGETPTNEIIIPGVKDFATYKKNRMMWDEMQQCVSLDAEFWEGAETYLFPKEWLDRAHNIADRIGSSHTATHIGVDPAEGGDNTCWSIVGKKGLIELISEKTPDTSKITGDTIALMQRYKVSPHNVLFDRGGGGKQHADRLRQQGYKVRTVAFGETLMPDPKRGITFVEHRKEHIEERYVYKNRRAHMYGILSQLLDPINSGFGIPKCYTELRRQLSVMPRRHDGEGRLVLPPKNKRSPNSTEETIMGLLGCSPDEADATVLATFGLMVKVKRPTVGAF